MLDGAGFDLRALGEAACAAQLCLPFAALLRWRLAERQLGWRRPPPMMGVASAVGVGDVHPLHEDSARLTHTLIRQAHSQINLASVVRTVRRARLCLAASRALRRSSRGTGCRARDAAGLLPRLSWADPLGRHSERLC